jgi:hypothetical protein
MDTLDATQRNESFRVFFLIAFTFSRCLRVYRWRIIEPLDSERLDCPALVVVA